MIKLSTVSNDFKERLALQYSPVGFYHTSEKPGDALGFKKKGNGCIMPLIFRSSQNATVAFDENSTGWECSAFFLGYKDWIFKGIEYFLSRGPLIGRNCERFIKTPALAREFVKSLRYQEKTKGAIVFKPLENFSESEQPEAVIFFANPDQLSALVYLLHYNAPLEENRVVTRFASACGSVVTLPLLYARRNQKTAVWGLHDISARSKLPKEIMSLTMPFELLMEIRRDMKESFLTTAKWEKIIERMAS